MFLGLNTNSRWQNVSVKCTCTYKWIDLLFWTGRFSPHTAQAATDNFSLLPPCFKKVFSGRPFGVPVLVAETVLVVGGASPPAIVIVLVLRKMLFISVVVLSSRVVSISPLIQVGSRMAGSFARLRPVTMSAGRSCGHAHNCRKW